MLYLISYDLKGPDPQYEVITESLKDLGAERVLQSVWILEDNEPENSERELRKDLRGHLVSYKDKLLVVTLARGTDTRISRKLRARPVRKLDL